MNNTHASAETRSSCPREITPAPNRLVKGHRLTANQNLVSSRYKRYKLNYGQSKGRGISYSMALGYVLSFLSWIAGYLAILFEVVSIACGLYYAAELAEEYSKMARRIISVAIGVVVAVHLLLLLEDLPWWLLLCGVGCHCIYFLLLTDFPNVQVFSLKCLGSLVAVLADHFLWFRYFRTVRFEVAHTLAIFMLLVWLIPFALFVTLTTSDMSLPLSTRSSCSASSPSIQGMPTPRTKHRKAGGLRGLLDGLNAHILPGTTKRV